MAITAMECDWCGETEDACVQVLVEADYPMDKLASPCRWRPLHLCGPCFKIMGALITPDRPTVDRVRKALACLHATALSFDHDKRWWRCHHCGEVLSDEAAQKILHGGLRDDNQLA